MQTSKQIFASFALGAGILLALPGIAQADNDRPHVGVNLSIGAPVNQQPAYVYAPPRPAYIHAQPRVVHFDHGRYDHGRYDHRRYDRRDGY